MAEKYWNIFPLLWSMLFRVQILFRFLNSLESVCIPLIGVLLKSLVLDSLSQLFLSLNIVSKFISNSSLGSRNTGYREQCE